MMKIISVSFIIVLGKYLATYIDWVAANPVGLFKKGYLISAFSYIHCLSARTLLNKTYKVKHKICSKPIKKTKFLTGKAMLKFSSVAYILLVYEFYSQYYYNSFKPGNFNILTCILPSKFFLNSVRASTFVKIKLFGLKHESNSSPKINVYH